MVGPRDLTKAIELPTNVPAPRKDEAQDKNARIVVTACSELLEYQSPVDYLQTQGKFQVIQGFSQETVIFAIGEDQSLISLTHEQGGASGWTLTKVSSFQGKVKTFDAAKFERYGKSDQPAIILTAAVADGNGLTNIQWAKIVKAPKIEADESESALDDWKDIEWTTIVDPAGSKSTSSLQITTSMTQNRKDCPFLMCAGSEAQGLKAATYYIVDPNSVLADPWTSFAPDTHEHVIKDVQPATIGSGPGGSDRRDGVIVFSKNGDASDCLFYGIDPNTLKREFSTSLSWGPLGKVHSIHACKNPWDFTVTLMACEKGIGLVDHRDINAEPITVHGLPTIPFKQVVCTEMTDAEGGSKPTILTIFAVSRDGDLYFIEGKRDWTMQGKQISLRSSGIPVRANVAQMSSQYNAQTNGSELIYVGTGNNEIYHLLRDRTSSLWYEDRIRVDAPERMKPYNAFVTILTLSTTDQHSIEEGFRVGFTSQAGLVLANDRSYVLSKYLTHIGTDSLGQIALVSPADQSLAAPSYTIRIENGGVAWTKTISAGQRVENIMSNIKTRDDLTLAKSTTGERVFSDEEIEEKKDKFDECAMVLQNVPEMLDNVRDNGEDEKDTVLMKSLDSTDTFGTSLTMESESAGQEVGIMLSWSDVTDTLGDFIEGVKTGFNYVWKPVIDFVKGALEFTVKIADRLFKFVLKTLSVVVKFVLKFCKDYLGFDLAKWLKMLGLWFDAEDTKKAQEVMKSGIRTLFKIPAELSRHGPGKFDKVFDKIERVAQEFIDNGSQYSYEQRDTDKMLKNSPISSILNNPVMKVLQKINPLGFIMEILGDTLGDSKLLGLPQVDDFSSYVQEILKDSLTQEMNYIISLVEKLWERIKDLLTNPPRILQVFQQALGDIFHTFFGMIKTAVNAALKVLGSLAETALDFMEKEWKIPFITTYFEHHAEQDLTLINMLTFVIARIVGVTVGDENAERYLDFRSHASSALDRVSDGKIYDLYGDDSAVTMQASIVSSSSKHELSPQSFSSSVAGRDKPITSAGFSADLSSEEQAALDTFESRMLLASTSVSCCNAAFTLVSISLVNKKTPRSKSEKIFLMLGIVFSAGEIALGALELSWYDTVRKTSPTLRLRTDQYHNERVAAYFLTIVGGSVEVVGSAALLCTDKIHNKRDIELALICVGALCTIPSSICGDTIPQFHSKGEAANWAKAANGIGIGGTVAGCVGGICEFLEQSNYAAGFAAADATCAVVSILCGLISLTA